MELRPIPTEAEYDAALSEIDKQFDALPETTDGDRVKILTMLVMEYERNHYPMPRPIRLRQLFILWKVAD